jgi:glycogen phosphorylase
MPGKAHSLHHEELIRNLRELAMDLHWTWNHATDKVWRELDPVLWELTHNPLVVMQTVSRDRMNEVLNDPVIAALVEELVAEKHQHDASSAWFQKNYGNSELNTIAYFSMEFMLSEALPIYSGGLGNVAGDHLKTASDLGVPVIGIGLLYQQGYPRQIIYPDGTQQYVAPYNDPGQLPITPLRHPNGEWLRIEIRLPGYSLWLRTWSVQVGRSRLLLLDSNDAANFPLHRGITSELYGGGAELRLVQEIILGMGGWRLLKALGLKPSVCHLNEGHAAIVVLERALDFMEENNESFEVALNVTRCANIFTTHTAVRAGFDVFTPELVAHYLGNYISEKLKISFRDFLALGRKNPEDETEGFTTAFLAVRGSGFVNGVSQLHGRVSRQLFSGLFPRWPFAEVPIGHITNGVHMPSWDSAEADKLWTEACGKDRWLGNLEQLEEKISGISDERIWSMRCTGEELFIESIRRRYARQLATTGASLQEIAAVDHLFDPNILTLGFARRFAAYKRPNLLLYHPERLRRILTNKERPVQLILAGKAHPGDGVGQAMIRDWIHFINEPDIKQKLVFLSDDDMLLTEQLVQGVDLWINTPRRPWEACGTSGMKVLVNGGLNCSELDGWWDKVYSPEVGWAFGDRKDHKGDPAWDAEEAEQLYNLLENEIIPEFYDRNTKGIPEKWVSRIRQSMARLTPLFSSNRSLKEYTETYYLPAALNFQKRAANHAALGKAITNWKQNFTQHTAQLRFGHFKVQSNGSHHQLLVELLVDDPAVTNLRVELYADGVNDELPVRQEMEWQKEQPDATTRIYTATIPAGRPATDYTPRLIPDNADISIPLECNYILWQR